MRPRQIQANGEQAQAASAKLKERTLRRYFQLYRPLTGYRLIASVYGTSDPNAKRFSHGPDHTLALEIEVKAIPPLKHGMNQISAL